MQKVDWSSVEPDVIDFVFYQSEKYLDAQFQSGVAADSRAITATSIFVGLAAASSAGAGSLIISSQQASAYLAAAFLAVGFSIAAFLCFRAAEPVDFYPAGNQPKQWIPVLGESLYVAKGGEIENYQEMISDNELALDRSARRLRRGVLAALASPAIALLIFANITFSS